MARSRVLRAAPDNSTKAERHEKPGGGPNVWDVYPAYDATAKILATLRVPPDFESDADVRYAHRRDNGQDIYFVGNRTALPMSAACRFRVVGRRPELWNPMTGDRRALPEFRSQDGRTVVPLQFAPGESYFVVFRNGPRPTGRNFPEWKPVAEIAGPWPVSFDPKWGGSIADPVNFDKLEDWTARPEDGIRYYSGTAVSGPRSTGRRPPGRIVSLSTWAVGQFCCGFV